jgi:hypothetical protein
VEQLFTVQFWHDQWAFIMSAPWVIVPLLAIAAVVGWKIKGALDGRELRGLRAENAAANRQLELARDEQTAITTQLETLHPRTEQLATEIIELKAEVARMRTALPGLDRVAVTSAVVASTVSVLAEANSALGVTLSPGPGHFEVTGFPAELKVTKTSE